MALFDKLGRAARTAGEKAGAAIEIGKLNVKIQAEKGAIERVKTQLGDLIWQDFEAGEPLRPELAELCEKIKDSLTAIEILRSAIDTVKAQEGIGAAVEPDSCDCGCEDEDQEHTES